ncbi:dephospho-CoA kinase [Gilvimarinus polysaccharolyticus]|uniref:dephospho-CoA kinase n=1 Tax=Gilvimarinus polysaccharolyticus TaxID=863921 RepID=UPI000673498F|nr:dephospho-CoA kinase [Gilvimarinus polysaccharolyticus]
MPATAANKPLVIGLTGGIGSGKSAASEYFARLGIDIVDADIVAREVVEPGSDALLSIAQYFGPKILLADGSLDRVQLRNIIFSAPKEKTWLESLLHPLINQRLREQLISATSAYVVFSSPLLLETPQHQLTDRIVVVDCTPEIQIQRAAARDNMKRYQVEAIMATQINRAERLSRADDILMNQGSLQELATQVLKLHQQYLAAATKSSDNPRHD